MSDDWDTEEMMAMAYLDQIERERIVRGKLWVTQSGEEIPVAKMTDSHLINAARWLERKAEKEGWIKRIDLSPSYLWLKEEIIKRGL